MSLYADHEVCTGCRFATFHSCWNCLKFCGAYAQGNIDRVRGTCSSREEAGEDDRDEG